MSESIHECGQCGDTFDTQQGCSLHQTRMHNDKKWREEDWLREQYVDKQKSMMQIARDQDCGEHAISDHLEKFGIEKREHGDELKAYWQRQPAPFFTGEQHGYEFWRFNYDYEQFQMQHHRLLAVAEYGIDAVKDKEVHHKNGIPWDNRPSNLEVVTRKEHLDRHYDEIWPVRDSYVTEEECQEYRKKRPDKSFTQIAKEHGKSTDTVIRHVRENCQH